MEVIVHYPETDAQREQLRKRVSAVHAEVVCRRLQMLSCPAEQKKELLKRLLSGSPDP